MVQNVRFLWALVGALTLLLVVMTWAWYKESSVMQTVAVIGKDKIMESEYLKVLKEKYGRQTLTDLINRKVVFQEAEKQGIAIEQSRIDEEIQKIKGNFSAGEDFAKQLKEQVGADLKRLENEVRYQLLLQELATREVTVTEDEMRTYYGKHQEEYAKPMTVRARQIVVASQEEAEQVREELLNGSDFGTLAKERSLDSLTSSVGGETGWLKITNEMPVQLRETYATLPKGEISDPVLTKMGYAIIAILERHNAEQLPFEKVKDQIQRDIALAKIESLDQVLERLKESLGIEVYQETMN